MSVLYGVGVGPGGDDLLTLRAIRLLQEVAVVAAIAAPDRPSRAVEIARPHLPPACRPRVFAVPMASRAEAEAAYAGMAETLAGELQQGRSVALLCEGDPLFYGSFIYLQRRLQGRFPVRVIPGVSALSAAAAALGRPLACQDQSLAVIPAGVGEERLRAALAAFDTVVILKAGRHREAVTRLIHDSGRAAEAWYCQEVGGEAQQLLPVEGLPPGPGPYFSLFLVSRGCP